MSRSNDRTPPAPTTGSAGASPSHQATVTPGEPTALPAQSTLTAGGRYVFGAEIARGAMGVVYRATDTTLGREVAVKLLHERHAGNSAVADRFGDEARITAQLQHPGIPPVHDLGTLPDGRPFLAMKLIKGDTLEDLLALRPDPGGLGRFVAVFDQICQAVAYAHAHGVIHRDLKPGNVMVGSFGEVQVMDWGLAKVLASREHERTEPDPHATSAGTAVVSLRDSDGRYTEAGSVLGTPAFMAPEQAAGAVAVVDRRSDVFGLGAILAVILTGKPPFVAASSEAIRVKAAQGDVTECLSRLKTCGAEPELVALCKRCLSPRAEDRPGDAGQVAAGVAALRQAAEGRARAAELERVRAEGEKRTAELRALEERKRRRVQWALAGSVGLLLMAGLAFGWWQAEQSQVARERQARNGEAVAGLLDQCQQALERGDATTAALTLEAAQKRVPEGGAEDQAERLAHLQDDLALLRGLDDVDQFRWTPTHGSQFEPAAAVAVRYKEVLGRFGLDPEAERQNVAVNRASGSAMRARLVAAWDRLLAARLSTALLTALQAIDPDHFRNTVREAVHARDEKALTRLAGQAMTLALPAEFAVFLGEQIQSNEVRRALLQAAVLREPGDLGLLIGLANTYPREQREGAEERLRWFQAAVAIAPRNSAAHNNLGIALEDKGDLDGAAAQFKQAVHLNRGDAGGHNNLASVLAHQNDFAGAFAELKEALRLDPTHALAHFGLGVVLGKKNDVDGAISEYKEAIRFAPKLAVAHYGLGTALEQKNDLDGAVAQYKEAVRLDPSDLATHNKLGEILCDKVRDYDGAIAEFRKALRLNPNEAGVHHNLGTAMWEKNDLEGAMAQFQQALRLDPKLAIAHSNLGGVLRARGDVRGAIEQLQEAIRLDPNLAAPFNELGLALAEKGDVNSAIAQYKEGIRINPKAPILRRNLASSLLRKGDVDGAIAQYREVLRLKPGLATAHNGLGTILCDKRHDYTGAIAEFREALRLDPRDAAARLNLSIALFHLGYTLVEKENLEGAIGSYREALRLNPKYADAYHGLGSALAKKGDLTGAITQLTKALGLNPTNPAAAHYDLAYSEYSKGELNAAIAHYKAAIRLNPKFARAFHALGYVLEKKGDLEGAIAQYKQAVGLDPKNPVLCCNLGRLLSHKGDVDGAIAQYKDAIRRDPGCVPAHNGLGTILCDKRHDYTGAISEFRQALQLDPNNAVVRDNLATAMFHREIAARRTQEAIVHLVARSENRPHDTMLFLDVAALQAWFGQEKELADTCRRGLNAAKNTTDPETADRVAKACCLHPSADEARLRAALTLARRAVQFGKNSPLLPWFQMSLGLAEYRIGHFAQAEQVLSAAAKGDKQNSYLTVTSALYRAMSLFRQGKEGEAQKLMSAAAARMPALPKDEKNPLVGNSDHDDLIRWMAFKEAKALIKSTPTGPRDPNRLPPGFNVPE